MDKVKKEVLIALLVLGCSAGCYAATPLPKVDSQQRELAGNMLGEQEKLILDSEDLSGQAEKGEVKIYIKAYSLDTSEITKALSPPQTLLEKYSGQKLSVGELKLVTKQVSDYYRRHGYPVATAFLPRQEIVDGIVEIKVLPGVLDQVVLKNNSGLKDSFVQGFIQDLHSGMQMDGDILSRSLNNLNALPGIRARGILEPGTKVGSSSLTVVLEAAPVIEGAVYTDNSGGKYSGRYRYGGQIVVNEPFKNGDRFVAGGLLSNENMRNYNFGYEMAVNKSGGRLGISCAESDYELGDYFAQAGAVGTAKTASIYGSQPLGGGQLRLIYGYEHNRLNDELRIFDYAARKSSDVFHLGLTGSVNSAAGYTGYSAVWRAGNLKLCSAEALAADAFNDTEGGFSKINFDVNHVTNLGRLTQFYLFAHGQMASRNLDSSEQFYLGGADAVRAYPQGEAGGDSGYQATAELRHQMPVKGLSLALFADVGEVLTRKDGETADPHRRLAGWGIGAVYSRSRSVYARLDYARKIKGEPYRSEAEDRNGRLWFRLYKLF